MPNYNSPSNYVDLTNSQFDRLRVKGRAGSDSRGKALWYCVCICGGSTITTTHKLRSSHTTSCGCKQKEQLIERNWKHGRAIRGKVDPIYAIWSNMKDRCNNPKNPGYLNYGGRGITVCTEWMDDPEAFVSWARENGWQEGLECDRIDNNGDYSPDNCHFVPPWKNQRNKRDNRVVVVFGESLPLVCAVEKYSNQPYMRVLARLNLGWPPEAALTAPKGTRRSSIIKLDTREEKQHGK